MPHHPNTPFDDLKPAAVLTAAEVAERIRSAALHPQRRDGHRGLQRARLRSARRWRPEELRQEQAGTQTLGAFFEQWWVERAMAELARATLAVYRCLWEAHAAPRLARLPMRDIDVRRVVAFRGELLAAGVGSTSVVKTMAMLQRVFRDAVEYGDGRDLRCRRPRGDRHASERRARCTTLLRSAAGSTGYLRACRAATTTVSSW